jgi:hypothetical protein
MAAFVDLTNNTFGVVTAISKLPERDSHGAVLWLCQCQCGEIIKARSGCLKAGHITSCGCKTQYAKNNSHKNWRGYGEISSKQFGKIKKSALARKHSFEVTIEECWHLFLQQNRQCALSGLNIFFAKSNRDKPSASLDRIDPRVGYIAGNIQWVHKNINRMKSIFSESDFINMCRTVSEFKK